MSLSESDPRTPPWPTPGGDREDDSDSRGFSRAGLGIDIALPLIAYYALHALGSSDWAALLAATAAAGLRLVLATWWARQVSYFSAIMLIFLGVGLALALLKGDARFLLLKDSLTTGLLGALFLSSLATSRPFALAAAQASRASQAHTLDHLYRARPAGRRVFRVSTTVWGAGLLSESLVRLPLVYLLPVDVMVGLSTALLILAMAGLAGWNVVYVLRAADRHPELQVLLPGHARS